MSEVRSLVANEDNFRLATRTCISFMLKRMLQTNVLSMSSQCVLYNLRQ